MRSNDCTRLVAPGDPGYKKGSKVMGMSCCHCTLLQGVARIRKKRLHEAAANAQLDVTLDTLIGEVNVSARAAILDVKLSVMSNVSEDEYLSSTGVER